MESEPRPFWNPLAAGIVLGLALLLTFVITGNGLGASGFVTRMAVQINAWTAPEAAAGNAYFGPFVQAGAPLVSWITWEVIGVLAGAWLGSRGAGRTRVKVERGARVSVGERFAWAFAGGAR